MYSAVSVAEEGLIFVYEAKNESISRQRTGMSPFSTKIYILGVEAKTNVTFKTKVESEKENDNSKPSVICCECG